MREWLLENFAGDLDHDPRRGVFYMVTGAFSIALWFALRDRSDVVLTQSVLGLGGLALLVKGIFFLRKQSAGFGTGKASLVERDPKASHSPGPHRNSLPHRLAQFVQDFAVGPLLLWPLLNIGRSPDNPRNPHELAIFLSGALLFAAGWIGRRVTVQQSLDKQ
jgi:hypothetical protein